MSSSPSFRGGRRWFSREMEGAAGDEPAVYPPGSPAATVEHPDRGVPDGIRRRIVSAGSTSRTTTKIFTSPPPGARLPGGTVDGVGPGEPVGAPAIESDQSVHTAGRSADGCQRGFASAHADVPTKGDSSGDDPYWAILPIRKDDPLPAVPGADTREAVPPPVAVAPTDSEASCGDRARVHGGGGQRDAPGRTGERGGMAATHTDWVGNGNGEEEDEGGLRYRDEAAAPPAERSDNAETRDAAASSDGDEEDEDAPRCRICYGTDNGGENGWLFRPCLCGGSMANVHVKCLETWRVTSDQAAYKCQSCGYEYCVAEHGGRLWVANLLGSRWVAEILAVISLLLLIFVSSFWVEIEPPPGESFCPCAVSACTVT